MPPSNIRAVLTRTAIIESRATKSSSSPAGAQRTDVAPAATLASGHSSERAGLVERTCTSVCPDTVTRNASQCPSGETCGRLGQAELPPAGVTSASIVPPGSAWRTIWLPPAIAFA